MDNIAQFNRTLLIIGNILSWVLVVIVSSVYGSGHLRHHPSYIASLYPTLFTPADWAFSIWIVIFILTGLFVFYHATPSKRDSPMIFIGVGPLFILHNLFMFIWLFCFSYNSIWASLVFMIAVFITMLIIYIRLGINYSSKGRARFDLEGNPISRTDFWLLQVPFSISLGWLSVALAANFAMAISARSHHLGWNAQGWSVLLQVLLSIFAFIILRVRHDPFFAGPIAWGLIGIADRYHGEDVIVTSALVAATIVGIASIATFFHILFHFLYGQRYSSIHN